MAYHKTAFDQIELNTFAAACYDQNTIDDLDEALKGDPDNIDMSAWNISADEWRSHIKLALEALKDDIA